jgi:hypothetical protein
MPRQRRAGGGQAVGEGRATTRMRLPSARVPEPAQGSMRERAAPRIQVTPSRPVGCGSLLRSYALVLVVRTKPSRGPHRGTCDRGVLPKSRPITMQSSRMSRPGSLRHLPLAFIVSTASTANQERYLPTPLLGCVHSVRAASRSDPIRRRGGVDYKVISALAVAASVLGGLLTACGSDSADQRAALNQARREGAQTAQQMLVSASCSVSSRKSSRTMAHQRAALSHLQHRAKHPHRRCRPVAKAAGPSATGPEPICASSA